MRGFRQSLLIGLFSFALPLLTETGLAQPADSIPKASRLLEGTVTLVDTNRNLVVLQDHSRAIPVKLDSMPPALHPGERVAIQGKVSPYVGAFPDYPDKPSGHEILPSFEAPTDWSKHYLTRMRGFLRPPADGEYTFWIAGDDEAKLLLSSDQQPANARKIAFAPRATWPREWDRYPQQKSEPIFLKASQTYYIEALQRQWRGHDCLAVAWKGPGISQSVIDSKYLSPDQNGAAGAGNGILREYWTNFFLTSLSMLVPEPQGFGGSVPEPRVTVLGDGNLPQPSSIHIGEPWSEANNFRWVQVEGTAAFVARDKGDLTVELTNADGRMTAHVFNWGTNSVISLENRKVRICGVCEGATSEKGEPVAGTLWAPDAGQIKLLDFADDEWSGLDPVPMFDLVPSNPDLAWGRRILVHGTLLDHGSNSNTLPVQGDDSFYGYISDDGTNWSQVGVPVSIALSDSAYAGMAVSSMSNYQLPTATFEQGSRTLETSRFASLGAAGLQFSNALFTVQVHSGGIDDTEEKCNFLFKRMLGEGEIVARLKSFQGAHVSDKAGIMIRESLEDSPSVALVVTPESKISLQYQTPGGSSRVVSLVLNRTPNWFKLVRRRHLLTVIPRQNQTFPPHKAVEILGNLTWRNNLPVLTDADIRPIATTPAAKPAQSSKVQYIRIKDLPSDADESSLRYASRNFRVRGVVTFSDHAFNRNLTFIQDDSAGALVRVLPEMVQYKPLEAGQFVEAEGSIKFSKGAAPLGIGTATVLGSGQMPAPLPFPYRATSDAAEGQWVEARGIIRSVQDDGTLLLMEKDGNVKIWVGGARSALERYVDTLVQIRGVYSHRIQSDPVLLVPSLDYIQVQEAPPANRFVIPSFTVDQVNAQQADPQTLHRIKVTGVVTFRDGNLLFVQDNTGSVQVSTISSNAVHVGDLVETVGFPEKHSGFVTFTEALVRRVGRGQPPKPAVLSPADVAEGRYNGSLVRLDAIVLEQKIRNGEQLLELQTGPRVFRAILSQRAPRLASFPVGSRVRVTGINSVQFASHINAITSQQDNSTPATLDVLLRGPADVVLLQRPPWWNWKYSVGLGALCAVIFAISLMWIRTLRRRVDERTRELKAAMARLQKETETSATLVERDRLAGEIHDSLEQGLNGIMMQLDGVDSKLSEDSNGARHYLEMARNMVRFSRAEVRHSLWNLESELLSKGDLGAALTEIARQMSSSNRVRVAIEVLGKPAQLPPATEHHLLRICQEALNNALKHAEAKHIQITLNYSGQSVRLSVADDGRGFAPDSVLTGTGMHLGLRNLRSRARKIKGRLDVISQPAKGTTIEVKVPINGAVDGTINHN